MNNKLLTNFAGGVNVQTNPILIRDIDCEKIINYSLDKVGSLLKRNGYDTFASQPVAGKQVVGLYQYTNTSSAAETTQVMVANAAADANTVIYYNNSGTWTTSKSDTAITTWTNFNRYRFATFLDYIFRVNGTAAVASSNNVNGTTWGTTNCPTVITPAFIAVFKKRVYVANQTTLYWSSTEDSGSLTWDTTNDMITVNSSDGDSITALENNGNRLLIFKNRAMYRWDYGLSEPERLFGVGTESQESVKTNLDVGITFFANSKGVYAYSSGRPKLISRKIQPWIDAVAATDWDDVCAEVDADHYYLYLSDSLTVDSETYTNVMAVYNIPLDSWTIYCLNTPVRFMAKLILSGAEGIYFGNSQGRTYLFNSGLEDDSTGANYDTAVNIHTEVITKEYLLSFPTRSVFEYVDLISENCVGTTVFYQLDRTGTFLPIKTLPSRFESSKHVGKECYSVRFKFSDSTSIASRIDAINIRFTPTKEKK